MKVQELREFLSPLNAEAIRRLAVQLDIPYARKDELVDAIASRCARRPGTLFERMRRDDLYACLKDWTCQTPQGEFALNNLSSARLSDLLTAARRIWVENWLPSREGERVAPGSEITALLLDDVGDSLEMLLENLKSFTEEVEEAGEAEEPDASLPAVEDISTIGDALADVSQRGLAPFQQEAVVRLSRRLDAGRRRALLCLPTGGGKTRTALHLLLTRYTAERRKVLWVTHRLDLLDQVHEEIRESVWQISKRRVQVRVSRIHGGVADTSGDFILASSMTLVRNETVLAALNRDHALAVVVYDEAHRLVAQRTWKAIQRLLQGERALLGLTATPYRKDPAETRVLEQALGKPAFYRSFGDLLQAGFLARPVFLRQRMLSTEAMRLSEADVRVNQGERDFSSSVLRTLARNKDRDTEIVSHWRSRAHQFGKTIAFACDIEHAEQLARTFKRNGVASDTLHSRHTPERRRRALIDFKSGATQVLVNVGILTEGTNVPDTRTVLLARPTLSRSLYMQMIGRGARGPSAVQGKTVFYVIDCVDNFQQHGFESAGAEVARELEEAMRLADPNGAPTADGDSRAAGAGSGASLPQLPRSGLTDAALRLLLRGFSPTAYTLWGQLRWGGVGLLPRGSAPIFLETHGQVAAALQLLRTAKSMQRVDWIEAAGLELDALGALRREEWAAAWMCYRDYGVEPQLVEVRAAQISPHDALLAERIESMARQHMEWAAQDWLRFLHTDTFLRRDMEAVFGTLEACAAVLARVALELRRVYEEAQAQAQAPQEAPRRDLARDARDFSTITYALLPQSDHTRPREAQIIEVSCGMLYSVGSTRPASAPTEDELRAAAWRLGAGVTSERGAETMDHILRVVLADEVVDDHERRVLHLVAPYFGVADEVLAGRLVGMEAPEAEVAREQLANSGSLTCHVCSEVLPAESHFCGVCGNALDAPPDSQPPHSAPPPHVEPAHVGPALREETPPHEATGGSAVGSGASIQCPTCRTEWPVGSRFCGGCAAPMPSLLPDAPGAAFVPSSPTRDEGRPPGPTSASRPPTPYGNPQAGYAAENWLFGHLVEAFGHEAVARNVSPFNHGQSDFVVKARGWEFHIELKHVEQVNGQFHWSAAQVELARAVLHRGHSHALVVAHPRGDGSYRIFWCFDPYATFHNAPKKTAFHCSFEAKEADGQTGWDRAPPSLDGRALQWSVGYWVPLSDGAYSSMREIAVRESPIAPVIEWERRTRTS